MSFFPQAVASNGAFESYAPTHMYGAHEHFGGASSLFLRGLSPLLLQLESVAPFAAELKPLNFTGPPSLGGPAGVQRYVTFNPTIVPAPRRLCPRCAFVASLRVEPLHQCDGSTPLLKRKEKRVAANAWFHGTAIVALDAQLRLLGWTWLINDPFMQVARTGEETRRWFVPMGASGGFAPPWTKQAYDARLINVAGTIFCTYICKGCDFSISQLAISATPTPGGGLEQMRVWAVRRRVYKDTWLQGRNQALFAVPVALPSSTRVLPALRDRAANGWRLLISSWVGGAVGTRT